MVLLIHAGGISAGRYGLIAINCIPLGLETGLYVCLCCLQAAQWNPALQARFVAAPGPTMSDLTGPHEFANFDAEFYRRIIAVRECSSVFGGNEIIRDPTFAFVWRNGPQPRVTFPDVFATSQAYQFSTPDNNWIVIGSAVIGSASEFLDIIPSPEPEPSLLHRGRAGGRHIPAPSHERCHLFRVDQSWQRGRHVPRIFR